MRGSGKALRTFGLIFCFLPICGNLIFPASASEGVKSPAPKEPAAGWYTDSLSEFSLTDASQLSGFAELVNKGASFSGKTVRLANDVDLAQLPWTAIGTEDAPFQGTFEGNGHTISGLLLKNTDDNQGFFGCIDGKARVENFTLEGSVSGGLHTGGAVGWAKNGILDHIVSRVSVTAENTGEQNSFAGGIAGRLAQKPDQSGSVVVSCCRNEGSVCGDAAGGIAGEVKNGSATLQSCVNGTPGGGEDCGKITGGLAAGLLAQAYQINRSIVISNCVNYAPITSEGGVGGIAGMFSGTVNSCENVGNLTSGSGVAGIVNNIGSGNSAIRNCTNSGVLTCSSANASSVGGIAAVSSADSLTVESCQNDGAIRANRQTRAGGILADGCFSDAVAIRTCRNTGSMTGGFVIAGGITGIGAGEISGCANLGSIACTSSGPVNAGDLCGVGGIVGVEYIDTVLKCSYNRGEIRGAADGSESCRYGGIAGYLYPGAQYTLQSNYSAAPVLATRGSAGAFAGELASASSASAKNYYDGSLCSAQGVGGKNPGGAWLAAETPAAMTAAGFAKKQLDGSQFAADSKHRNGGYPVLSWEVQTAEKNGSGESEKPEAPTEKTGKAETAASKTAGVGPSASAQPEGKQEKETGLSDGKSEDPAGEDGGQAKPAAKPPKVLRGVEIIPAETPAPNNWGMAKVLASLFAALLTGAASVRFLVFRNNTRKAR